MTGAPAEQVAPEEMIEPGEADMLAAPDEDIEEAVDEDADETEEVADEDVEEADDDVEEMEEAVDEDTEEMEEAVDEDTDEEVVSTPDQGTEPETPEIVAPAPLPAPSTSLPSTDEGQLANHRVQINIAAPAIGALVTDRVPTITVTMRNVSSGETRTLANMAPTNDVLAGPSEWRFANDLYLPDGIYTMTVEVNGERALFERVVVPNNSATAPTPGFTEQTR
jgi:hypothetical protein